MASSAQIAANRANSQHSTGPHTESGKAAAAQNSTKLGLTCRIFPVLDWECQDTLTEYTHVLIAELRAVGTLEVSLVAQMAQHHWSAQRAFMAQDGCFEKYGPAITQDDKQKEMGLYLRYQAMHERAFHKCRQELLRIQQARQTAPIQQELAQTQLTLARQTCERNELSLARLRSAAPESPALCPPAPHNPELNPTALDAADTPLAA